MLEYPHITHSKGIITEIPSWWREEIGAHVVEEHTKGSTNPKALENPNMPRAGTSWDRQGVESCNFQNFCSQILAEKLIEILTLQELSVMWALCDGWPSSTHLWSSHQCVSHTLMHIHVTGAVDYRWGTPLFNTHPKPLKTQPPKMPFNLRQLHWKCLSFYLGLEQ